MLMTRILNMHQLKQSIVACLSVPSSLQISRTPLPTDNSLTAKQWMIWVRVGGVVETTVAIVITTYKEACFPT